MEDIISNILSIDLNAIIKISQLTLGVLVTLFIKSSCQSYAEYLKFCYDKRIGIGTNVRISSQHGFEDGYISDVSIKYIFITMKDFVMLLPLNNYSSYEWKILKNKPAWRNEQPDYDNPTVVFPTT